MFKPAKRSSNHISNHHHLMHRQIKHNRKTYKIIRMTRSFATAAVFITSVLTASVLLPAVESRSVPTSSVGKAAGYHHRVGRRFRRPSATAALLEAASGGGGDSSSSEEDLPLDIAAVASPHTARIETDDDSSEENLDEKEDNEDDYDLDDIEALEHLKTGELTRLLHLLESLRKGSLQVHQISGNDAAQLNLLLDKFGL